jgi:hypothetical protein
MAYTRRFRFSAYQLGMNTVAIDIGWAFGFVFLGAVSGMVLLSGAVVLLPKLLNRLSPNLDEEREIARGNGAVAEYFGRVVGATVIGMSIIIAAAILAGVLAGLH